MGALLSNHVARGVDCSEMFQPRGSSSVTKLWCVQVGGRVCDLEEVVDVFHLLLEANVVKVHSQAVLVVPVEVGEESFHQTVNEQNCGRGGGGAKGGREVKRFTMLKSFSSKQHCAYKLLI